MSLLVESTTLDALVRLVLSKFDWELTQPRGLSRGSIFLYMDDAQESRVVRVILVWRRCTEWYCVSSAFGAGDAVGGGLTEADALSISRTQASIRGVSLGLGHVRGACGGVL